MSTGSSMEGRGAAKDDNGAVVLYHPHQASSLEFGNCPAPDRQFITNNTLDRHSTCLHPQTKMDSWGSGNKMEKKENETFQEKTLRKFYNEPFIPAGALITVGFLTFGMKAFRAGDQRQAQIMMRWRVGAQAFTVAAMCLGAYFNLKPSDRPKVYEDVLKTIVPSSMSEKKPEK
jgi:hypothetical protein